MAASQTVGLSLAHLARALAVLLFNDYGYFQPAKCYLLEQGIDRLPPFLPLLKELAESGPFLFMATTMLNLLEVSPRPAHLPLIFAAAEPCSRRTRTTGSFGLDKRSASVFVW